MHESLRPIYTKYNESLKSLVSEIEGRLERFEEPLLENLMAQFDYVVLSLTEEDTEKKELYLSQANAYLDIAISNSYQYLIYALLQKIKVFKKRYGGKETIENLSDGGHAGNFLSSEKTMKDEIRKGRQLNEIEAIEHYRNAYNACIEQEKIIEKLPLAKLTSSKGSIGWTIIGMILSIVISIFAGIIVELYLS